jgi:hypothetical protein
MMRLWTNDQMRRAVLALTLIGTGACSAAEAISFVGRPNKSFEVSRGADFTIVLQTIGPGVYGNPAVSSGSVRFIDVQQAAFAVPAGPTQEFRFHAESAGEAVVVFQHSGDNGVVTDTVVVR